MLKYIELKTNHQHDGPAWIADVEQSRSGSTVYFNNCALRRIVGGGILGNYINIENDDEYWVSGPKKEGGDRHYKGAGIILVSREALKDYLEWRGLTQLPSGYALTDVVRPTDIQRFTALLNTEEHDPV